MHGVPVLGKHCATHDCVSRHCVSTADWCCSCLPVVFCPAAMTACTNVQVRAVTTPADLWTIERTAALNPTVGETSGEFWLDCSKAGASSAAVYGGKCYMQCTCQASTDATCVQEGLANVRNFYVRQNVNVAPANPTSVNPAGQKGLACSATLITQLTTNVRCSLKATLSCCVP
jgi:hypothetical protein